MLKCRACMLETFLVSLDSMARSEGHWFQKARLVSVSCFHFYKQVSLPLWNKSEYSSHNAVPRSLCLSLEHYTLFLRDSVAVRMVSRKLTSVLPRTACLKRKKEGVSKLPSINIVYRRLD